ncbi:MAG: hypothetical protein QG670_2676 [Thermoproteota archaeon]|nr:hypothetical protein [Thermoproteota archaeon]
MKVPIYQSYSYLFGAEVLEEKKLFKEIDETIKNLEWKKVDCKNNHNRANIQSPS